jgi:predicted dehydrogenase
MTMHSAGNQLSPGQPIGWGIIGTGKVAQLFASDLTCAPDARLVAVGSRSKARARAFGERFGVPGQHGSYMELVNDPHVQAVYIATPASAHKENMLLCLHAGKAVLCEKPFTVNAQEAAEVICLARDTNVFLMEAMWTRFVPLMVKVRELLAAGVIGDVRHFIADLGSRVPFDPQGRVFNAELGGGALLQKGIYLLSLASMILGCPSEVRGLAVVGETGVDEHAGILLGYPGPQLASLLCSVRDHTSRGATIVGTSGQISIHEPIISRQGLPYVGIRTRIGGIRMSERRVTLTSSVYSCNMANAVVSSGNSVSGIQVGVIAFYMGAIPRRCMHLL